MLITILVLLFVIVFVALAWRIIVHAKSDAAKAPMYVCPHCNEVDCECRPKQP